jgi:hypothetical protein
MDAAKISTCIDDALKKGNLRLSGAIFHTFSGFVTVAQHYDCSAACTLLCITTIHLVFQRINVSFPNILGLVLHKHMHKVLMLPLCASNTCNDATGSMFVLQFFTESGDLLLACRV